MTGTLPTIFDWLQTLQPIRGVLTLYLLALLGFIIFVLQEWRLTLFALLGHYLLAGLLFADVLLPHLAFVKVLTGLFVCLMLYLTARRVQQMSAMAAQSGLRPRARPRLQWWPPANTGVWRSLAILLVALLAIWLGQRPAFFLPGASEPLAHVNGAVFLLMGVGLLQMILGRDIWQMSIGFFCALIGFELFYNQLEKSAGMLAALAATTLAAALVVSYLAQAYCCRQKTHNDNRNKAPESAMPDLRTEKRE